MIYLYSLSIHIYQFLIFLFSFFNKKAKLWIEGRKNLFEQLEKDFSAEIKNFTWFHCASLGEFEQARPVIEKYKEQNPSSKILLTFFSPSGYEIRKNYAMADKVYYLPIDTANNAKRFIDIIQPQKVFFVKYEFWYYYLRELKSKNIPVYYFSVLFRPGQIFFKPWGSLHRSMLKNISHLFLQDSESGKLLDSINIKHYTVAGDTRFDRVKALCDQKKIIVEAEQFKGEQLCVVCGSVWDQDMEHLIPIINELPQLRWIIAPHEIHSEEIAKWQSRINKKSIRFSEYQTAIDTQDVLFIDNIGMLSSLYNYGVIAYIGGAFGKGLHNILEAATYGMPILFGPNYTKFKEAKDLIQKGSAHSIQSTEALRGEIKKLLQSEQREKESKLSAAYVQEHIGATEKILQTLSKSTHYA